VSTTWTVKVDRKACVGSGICASIAADHFVLMQGKSTARESLITPDDLAMDAAESCPAEAIEITDENGALLAPKK
jgi:ferredoxin